MQRARDGVHAGLMVTGLTLAVWQGGYAQQGNDNMAGSSTQSEGTGAEGTAAPGNRLAAETSPYLLQHAGNPVDWHPWGEEAFARARKENKPIFLSIGYSACHWCHVMERESFEDPQTAAILNEHFVAVKVDREERPDVDDIYMTAVQAMTGRGGWPLSVFLTPDLKPFFGGTYFPPEDTQGMPSFKRVLLGVAEAWHNKPDDVDRAAQQLVRAIRTTTAFPGGGPELLDESLLEHATLTISSEFDSHWGGYGGQPKFPPGAALALLLREHGHTGDRALLDVATLTLDRMAHGGMYDQIGGGFHRYSVDSQWLVPHFEKMLYDNAILAKVYLEAYQVTGKSLYQQVAGGILDYVLRDMTDPGGAFHSAEDADSEGEEGRFYVWRPQEVKTVLGQEDGELVCRHYGVTDAGNFEGYNILNVPGDPAKFAQTLGLDEEALEARLGPLRQKLLDARSERVRPGKDDKVLTAWNGMMISALARGYQVLDEPLYLQAAERAADFVLTQMVREGTLLHTYRDVGGQSGRSGSELPGYLDDYAEMAAGLVDLYEASFDPRWLENADRLAERMIDTFWDDRDGGFFFAPAGGADLLVRTKPVFDGAVPSGNATAALVLLRLSRLLERTTYREKAETVLRLMQGQMREHPRAYTNLLLAAHLVLRPAREIAILGETDDEDTRAYLEIIHERFRPNTILVLSSPGSPDAQWAEEHIPLLRGKTKIGGRTTVYVCQNYTCRQPATDAATLRRMLQTQGSDE